MKEIAANPILTEEQKSFLLAFRDCPFRDRYYLSGGTAAAFHLGHRFSDDLDLFTEEPVEIEQILAFLRSLADFEETQYQHRFDRRIFLLRSRTRKILNVEFTLYPFTRLEPGTVIDGIQVDGLSDILANKFVAMTDRRDPKDYIDVYFILKNNPHFDIIEAIQNAERKFGITGLKGLLRGRFLQGLPPLGVLKMREPLDPAAIAEFFAAQARNWISDAIKGES